MAHNSKFIYSLFHSQPCAKYRERFTSMACLGHRQGLVYGWKDTHTTVYTHEACATGTVNCEELLNKKAKATDP